MEKISNKNGHAKQFFLNGDSYSNKDEDSAKGGDEDEESEYLNNPDELDSLLMDSTENIKSKKWERPFIVFKSVGPKLVPFLKTLGMYFVIFIPSDRPSWFAVLIKCLPVASLALFVLLHGISLKEQHTFARRILAGLLFSCLGDALLVWPSYFVEGMIAFGVAQVMYIFAFGFNPMNWTLGVGIYGMTSIGLGLLVPGLMTAQSSLMIGVPLYVILLTTMVWRAMARVQFFDDLWSWTKICSCFGGLTFAVSDTILGLNKFYAEIPGSQALIMGTYYLAQLGIALSVVNSKGKDGGERRDASYLDQDEDDEDGTRRRNNVSWMDILEQTAPNTRTLEISPEEQREAELLYY